jgi:methyl-accepting chemotaxis protein
MKHLKIGVRLGFAFATILALFLFTAIVVSWRLHDVREATDQMARHAFNKERLVRDFAGQIQLNGGRIVAGARNPDPEQQKYFQNQIAATIETNNVLMKQIQEVMTSEAEKALLSEITDKRKIVIASNGAVFKEKNAGNEDAARKLLEQQLEPQLQSYLDSIKKLAAYEADRIDELAARVDSLNQSSERWTWTMTGLSILFGISFAYFMTGSVTGPINNAVEVARRVAAGDLTVRIDVSSRDETGQLMQSLKEMSSNLQRIVSEVRTGTHSLTTASVEIAAGNQDLSSRTEQQASALEETASSLEELTSTVRQNAENAHQANQLAGQASEVANRGGAVVSEVVGTMASINASSKKIADIIGVIDGIAFQTNILALNAAVEAARAGEQGRGFAVVASEVRSLAQRSAAAAKEIRGLISTSVEKVEAGTHLVDQAGATMQEIVDAIKSVSTLMSEIATASEEQSSGIDQINKAVSQMEQVTQQNASLVEEAAAASESMKEQAASLVRTVDIFKLDGVGASARVRHDAALPQAQRIKAAVPVSALPGRKPVARPVAQGDDWTEF